MALTIQTVLYCSQIDPKEAKSIGYTEFAFEWNLPIKTIFLHTESSPHFPDLTPSKQVTYNTSNPVLLSNIPTGSEVN